VVLHGITFWSIYSPIPQPNPYGLVHSRDSPARTPQDRRLLSAT
jgi:hypothetical protein